MIVLHANSEIDLYNKLYTYIQKEYAGEKPCDEELKKYFKILMLKYYCNKDLFCNTCTTNCTTIEKIGCTEVLQDGSFNLHLELKGNSPFNYTVTAPTNCFTCTNCTGIISNNNSTPPFAILNLNITSTIQNCFTNNLFKIDIVDATGCATTFYFYINPCHVFTNVEKNNNIIATLQFDNQYGVSSYLLEYTAAIPSNIISYYWISSNSSLPLLTNNESSALAISQSGLACTKNVTFELVLTNKENCIITKTLTLTPTC